MKNGIVYLVGAGPGDPGLLTLHGLECLKQANVVVYDRLINRALLAYARHAELIDVGKQPNCHTLPQAEINALLTEKARAGNIVVRLKGGDPFVFGRGGEEAIALAEAGLPFEIVPGVTSAIAAPAYAGIPVTHRNVARSLTIATGHREDSVEDLAYDWKHLARCSDTLVFLMGVRNLPHIVEQMTAQGRPPDTPVALVDRATCASQKTVVGTLANIVERAAEIRPPAAIIIGDVVRLRETLRWFDLPDRRPLLGLRVLNTRPLPQAAELSRRLMALGAEPVELPTTQVAPVTDSDPLDGAIKGLARAEGNGPAYDWIIFTSANSISFFVKRLFALGHDVRALAGVKLAVACRATADILLEHSLAADFIPTCNDIRGIATEIGDMTDQRVLMPCAHMVPANPSASTGLVDALRAQSALVEMVAAYTIQPANPDPVALSALLDGNVDVAAFSSPSSLASLAKMLNSRPMADVLSPSAIACIDPSTANTARELGLRVDVVAGEPTTEGLVEALVEWRSKGKR